MGVLKGQNPFEIHPLGMTSEILYHLSNYAISLVIGALRMHIRMIEDFTRHWRGPVENRNDE